MPTTAPDARAMVLAHLSDLHLGPLTGFRPRHWGLKRGLGYLNWHRGRKKLHRVDVVAMLVEDMLAQKPDHIALTGDLVNIGLPSEIAAAGAFLAELGAHDFVSVVPGNHDIYVPFGDDPGVARWAAYMSNDNSASTTRPGRADVAMSFPYVRRRGRVALVGVNSAEPTPPFVAAGRVPATELKELARILGALEEDGYARIVMIHHPPLPGQAPPRRALRNADAVAAVLRRIGADLVLHGHNHTNSIAMAEGPGGSRIPVVGISSGSASHSHEGLPLARYNLIRISFGARNRDDDPGHHIKLELVGRGLAEPAGRVVELERRMLTPGPRI